MKNYDFSPLFRSAIGFDRLFELADAAARLDRAEQTYPPFDIVAAGENQYRLSMAVAGFTDDDIDVEVRENTLTVTGKRKASDDEPTYMHRGIAGRDFVRHFELADHMEVTAAHLSNGILTVDMVRNIPEAMKPKRIEIKSGEPKSLPKAAKKLIENVSKKAA
ncbi:MAG: Hsp20 family protein [Rhodospirillales bacterium]